MHDVVSFLKPAVSREPNSGLLGCYTIFDGSISARNTRLQAGLMYPSDVSFSVPADELETALARIKTIKSFEFLGDAIRIKSGRIRSTIQCVQGEPPAVPEFPEQFSPWPRGLLDALKIATQFTAENGWGAGVRLMTGRVTAICNTRGVDFEAPGLNLPASLLAADCVEFLAASGEPSEYARGGNSVFFRWDDGRWMRAQVMSDEMPEMVDTIFASGGNDAPIVLTPEWREAYADAAALSDGTIMVKHDGIRGIKGVSENEVEFATGLPEGHVSYWLSKVLDPMMLVAERWNPNSYPRASVFYGNNLRGVVIGIKR